MKWALKGSPEGLPRGMGLTPREEIPCPRTRRADAASRARYLRRVIRTQYIDRRDIGKKMARLRVAGPREQWQMRGRYQLRRMAKIGKSPECLG